MKYVWFGTAVMCLTLASMGFCVLVLSGINYNLIGALVGLLMMGVFTGVGWYSLDKWGEVDTK